MTKLLMMMILILTQSTSLTINVYHVYQQSKFVINHRAYLQGSALVAVNEMCPSSFTYVSKLHENITIDM